MDELARPDEMILRFLVGIERQQTAKVAREVEETFMTILGEQTALHNLFKVNALKNGDLVQAAHHQVMAEAFSALLKNHVRISGMVPTAA